MTEAKAGVMYGKQETHDKVVGVVLKHLVILSNRHFALCLIFEFEEGFGP